MHSIVWSEERREEKGLDIRDTLECIKKEMCEFVRVAASPPSHDGKIGEQSEEGRGANHMNGRTPYINQNPISLNLCLLSSLPPSSVPLSFVFGLKCYQCAA